MTIYPQIEKIAGETVEAFFTDISHHDRPYVANMQPRDVALWQCRPCGSHMVTVIRHGDDKPNPAAAREFFEAIETQAPNRQWYLISKNYGADTVKPIDVPNARKLLREQIT